MAANKNLPDWINVKADDVEIGCDRTVDVSLEIHNIQKGKRKFEISITSNFSERDEMIEWSLTLNTGRIEEFSLSPQTSEPLEAEVEIEGGRSKDVSITIKTPKGGYKGDYVVFTLEIRSEDGIHSFRKSFKITLVPVIIALKTMVGKEIQVARDLSLKSERDYEERGGSSRGIINEVLSIMSPREVKGYIFVEAMHPDRVGYLAKGIRGYKGEVKGDISIKEIEHYLTPKPAVSGIELGALVELVDGPFKGERAKVMSIDAAKEEVTVQLVESMVPIPVTVKAEAIRMLEKI